MLIFYSLRLLSRNKDSLFAFQLCVLLNHALVFQTPQLVETRSLNNPFSIGSLANSKILRCQAPVVVAPAVNLIHQLVDPFDNVNCITSCEQSIYIVEFLGREV